MKVYMDFSLKHDRRVKNALAPIKREKLVE